MGWDGRQRREVGMGRCAVGLREQLGSDWLRPGALARARAEPGRVQNLCLLAPAKDVPKLEAPKADPVIVAHIMQGLQQKERSKPRTMDGMGAPDSGKPKGRTQTVIAMAKAALGLHELPRSLRHPGHDPPWEGNHIPRPVIDIALRMTGIWCEQWTSD